MLLFRRVHLQFWERIFAVVILIIPAEHLLVEHQSDLKRVTRRADANHRLAGFEVALEPLQLFVRQSHSSREHNEQVSAIEHVETVDAVRLLAFEVNRLQCVIRFEESGELYAFDIAAPAGGWPRHLALDSRPSALDTLNAPCAQTVSLLSVLPHHFEQDL